MTKSLLIRFWSKVDVRGPDECWEWAGAKTSKGYGAFRIGNHRIRKIVGTHRFSWELHNAQEVPEGVMVLHSCDNPSCVNPAHLHLGTNQDNMREASERGRLPGKRPGGSRSKRRCSKRRCSKLTEDQVREIRRLHATGRYTQTRLGQMFEVCTTTIHYIVHRETWDWL